MNLSHRSPRRIAAFAVLIALASQDAVPAAPPAKTGMSLCGAPSEVVPFLRFYAPGPREMLISPTIKAWDGKRVKIVGFMSEMENPSPGSFYLASHPLKTDEEGDSTGDIPPSAVRVVVRSAREKKIGFMPGLLSATGVFKAMPMTDAEGRTSNLNLILDRPEDLKSDSLKPKSATIKKPASSANGAKKAVKRYERISHAHF